MTSNIGGMLADTDSLWHIAAGDLIRETHSIPQYDTWSFTAGEYRWLNIAWLWDIIFSFIHEKLGWHGAFAINALCSALTITLIYINCIRRSKDFYTSLIVAIAAISAFAFHLRPLQISNIMTAIWLLILSEVMRHNLPKKWLILLPVSMLLWVNMHGGFIVSPILIGIFFLQALYNKDVGLAKMLFITGVLTCAAIFCTPYGLDIIESVIRPMQDASEPFIIEWKPLLISAQVLLTNLYLVPFILLVPWRKLPVFPCERWLAYAWFLAALICRRNMFMFVITAAPLLACALKPQLARLPKFSLLCKFQNNVIEGYNLKKTAVLSTMLSIALVLWLPSPTASKISTGDTTIVEPPYINVIAPEITYLQQHYPKARIISYYDFAAIVIYKTRGKIPVFIDPRTETALPKQVVDDYICIWRACEHWERLLDKYHIDGMLLPNSGDPDFYERFVNRIGWKQEFTSDHATLFMREKKS